MTKQDATNKVIQTHMLWAMGAGLIPIPILDFTAVAAIQLDMLSQLAKLYDIDYTTSTGKAFVTALTGSTAAQIGSSIVKGIPGIGTVFGGVSMSIMSGASTYAVGKVAVEQFKAGVNLSEVDLKQAKEAYHEAYEAGKEVSSDLKKEQQAS